jgi:hypothetical protein
MADANTHINYTIEDIERYLNGGMSAKEMHDMEKAALQDPFLADAIEGYSEASIQQSQKHLNEINALLQKEKEEAKVVIMPVRSFQWWKVAAMIILVAGVGAFSWYLAGLNKPAADAHNVAIVKENKAPAMDSNARILNYDTTALLAQQKAATPNKQSTKPNHHKEEPVAFENKAAAFEKDTNKVVIDDVAATKSDSVQFLIAQTAPGTEIAKADTKSAKVFTPLEGRVVGLMNNNAALNQFSGVVLDNRNQPVPGALVNTTDKRAVVTDNNGYFRMLAPDSTLQVFVSSVGYETTKTNLSPGIANRVAIEPSRQSLSDVVITGYGARKKEIRRTYRNADSAYPAGGWESFQEYVYKKMNMPFDSSSNAIITTHGAVEIEFSINEAGNPYNFNILQSSGKENDERAINTLKEGPRWITSKKNKKGKVVIQF